MVSSKISTAFTLLTDNAITDDYICFVFLPKATLRMMEIVEITV